MSFPVRASSSSVPALLTAISLCGSARGQASSDQALAESLFREGKKLMAEKKYADACPKLAASLQIDPSAGGTLITLASCHELEGKTATAWAEFSDAMAAAKRDARAEREAAAKKHIAALEPKLSKLTIRVDTAIAQLAGLEIKRDGAPMARAVWGVAAAVDPGEHTVTATAPGRKSWSGTVTLGASADQKALDVPPLVEEAKPAVPVAPPPIAGASAAPPSTASAPPAAAPPPPPAPEAKSHTAAYVVGGAGIVALAAGAFFGVQSLSKRSDVKSQCPANQCTSQSAVDENATAKTDAWISNVGIGLGVIGIGVGTYMLLSSPAPEKVGVRVTPAVGPSSGGLSMGGSF